MEKQVARFPHVAVKIFDFLDIRSLAKSREVCKLWKIFIGSSKFFWVKFINEFLKHSKQSEEIQRQWKRVLFMANIKQIIGIAVTLQSSMCVCLSGLLVPKDFSPLPVLAMLKDSVNLYKDLCKTIPNDKINPFENDIFGNSCLHIAACADNIDLFSFIIENVKEKNPKAKDKDYDRTPLHIAAYTGKLEICKIIIGNVVDLSCLDEKCRGETPFDSARSNNMLEICFYFNEVRNKSTFDVGWRFYKNLGTYFPEESEPRAVTATTATNSFLSLFWNKYMKN